MKDVDILAEVDRRFMAQRKQTDDQHKDQREYIDAKFTHLSAIIQDGFFVAEGQRKGIIARQDIANGRVSKLEKGQNDQILFCSGVQREKDGGQSVKEKIDSLKTIKRQKLIQTITMIIMAAGLAITAYTSYRNANKLHNAEIIEIKK